MKKNLLILFICLTSFNLVSAQEIDKVKLDKLKKELEVRGGGLVSDLTSRRMTRAGGELAANRYDRAIELLLSLAEATVNSNRYEHALALQMLGTTYIQAEQISKSIETLEKALSINALPYEPTLQIYYTLAQIYLATQKFQTARLKLKEWFYLARAPSPGAYILKAATYAEEKNYKRALELVEEGLKITKEPQEAWLAFAASLYYENGRLGDAVKILEKLTELDPKSKRYWRQLSGIYMSLDRIDEALSAMVLAQKLELLDSQSDFFTLCGLYNYSEIPVNCARALEAKAKAGEIEDQERASRLLSQAWIQAREPKKAIPYLQKLAELKNEGIFDTRRGYIYYQERDWKQAINAFEQAIARGNLDEQRKGDTLLSLGISYYQIKNYSKAIEVFTQAQGLKGHEASAKAWQSEVRQRL